MKKVVVDEQTGAQLQGLTEHAELCDRSGRTLGHYLPVEVYARLVAGEALPEVRKQSQGNPYPLRGTPFTYDRPTDPVAEEDWEAQR